jgi:hypothetical protein
MSGTSADLVATPSQAEQLASVTNRMSARQMQRILLAAFETMQQDQRSAVLDHVIEVAGGTARAERAATHRAEVQSAVARAESEMTEVGFGDAAVGAIKALSTAIARQIIAGRRR